MSGIIQPLILSILASCIHTHKKEATTIGQMVVHDSNIDLFSHCVTVFNCKGVYQGLSEC